MHSSAYWVLKYIGAMKTMCLTLLSRGEDKQRRLVVRILVMPSDRPKLVDAALPVVGGGVDYANTMPTYRR